jgi:dimethylglycine catabolism B
MAKYILPQIPALSEHTRTLETCVYCPKLCRSECPVSNALPSEALTPWGKMSSTYFVARGDVAPDPSFANATWACTGCGACTNRCDHRNDVTSVLFAARAALKANGMLEAQTPQLPAAPSRNREPASDLVTALVVGCSYGERETADAIAVAERLTGGKLAVVADCCGRMHDASGESAAFASSKTSLSDYLAGFKAVLVADAGCAETLLHRYPKTLSVSLLLNAALHGLADLAPLPANTFEGPVRFHDPCALGRLLGEYDAPRALLTRLLGETPAEFPYARDRAHCSGGGGLLPLTMPDVARTIAQTRRDEHEACGGGTIVTSCAGSLAMFRSVGANAIDLMTFVRRGFAAC